MIIKTVSHIPVCVWLASELIIDISAAQQKFGQRIPGRARRSGFDINLRTGYQTELNRLPLSTAIPIRVTFRPGVVRRRNVVKYGIQTTNARKFKNSEIYKSFTEVNNRRQTITRNAFIEVDVRRAFVPKRVPPSDIGSDISTQKPVNIRSLFSTTVAADINTTIYENDAESDSEIDTKVFDKLQQLDNTLTLMRDQVKNDKQTIDNLKSKMIRKDKELSELIFTDIPPTFNNRNIDASKGCNFVKEDSILSSSTLRKGWRQFISTTAQIKTTQNPYDDLEQISSKRRNVQVDTNRKDIEEGTMELVPDPFIRDSETKKDRETNVELEEKSPDISEKRATDNAQNNYNLIKLPSTNLTEIEEPQDQYSNDNSLEARDESDDYKEGDGQIKPGDDRFGPMKNNFMNSEEYSRKLYEEQIENGIDWQTFDVQKFLDKMDAAIQEVSKPLIKNIYVPSTIQKSGRRMIPNDALQIPNVKNEDYDDNSLYKMESSTNKFAPLPPRQRTVVLNTDFALSTSPSPLSFYTQPYDELLPELPHTERNSNIAPGRPRLAPKPGKQEMIADSTEVLIRNVLGKMNKARSVGKQPYDFDVIKQKINREGNKRREMIRKKIAERMTKKKKSGRRNVMTKKKISGRRNMNPVDDVYHYDTNELLKDPFLNDSYI